MSYTFDIHLGPIYAGLTLAAQLIDTAGDAVGSEVTTGFVEIGGGDYMWSATIPDDHQGGVLIYEDGTPESVLASASINPAPASGLTAQETANAVHNLAPEDSPAAGSIGDKLNHIKAITDALDVTAVTQVVASLAGHLTITVGLTFDEGVTGLTIPADWVTALWTLKNNARDADTAALVQLRATNPAAGTDGLQRLNGAALVAPITAADGELAVTQATGRIDVWLSDEMTVMLGAATAIGWDVKFIDAAGDSIGQRGTADVVLTETKATA